MQDDAQGGAKLERESAESDVQNLYSLLRLHEYTSRLSIYFIFHTEPDVRPKTNWIFLTSYNMSSPKLTVPVFDFPSHKASKLVSTVPLLQVQPSDVLGYNIDLVS
jgi:hypothetical protein